MHKRYLLWLVYLAAHFPWCSHIVWDVVTMHDISVLSSIWPCLKPHCHMPKLDSIHFIILSISRKVISRHFAICRQPNCYEALPYTNLQEKLLAEICRGNLKGACNHLCLYDCRVVEVFLSIKSTSCGVFIVHECTLLNGAQCLHLQDLKGHIGIEWWKFVPERSEKTRFRRHYMNVYSAFAYSLRIQNAKCPCCRWKCVDAEWSGIGSYYWPNRTCWPIALQRIYFITVFIQFNIASWI